MEIKDYIENTQEILYKILINSKKRGTFPQAFLLNGELEMPILDIAKFAAKSIICNNSNLACLDCESCKQIEENSYINFMIIDGETKNISKPEIQELIERFSKSSVENKDIYVYVINLVERSSQEAINAILKFLEEPRLNVHAILTTKNITKVLPTIISRCETINLAPINKSLIIDSAIKQNINQEEAELLSYFFVKSEDILDFAKNSEYLKLKSATLNYLDFLTRNPAKARFILETEVLDSIKNDRFARMFFDLITIFLKEAINLKFNVNHYLKTYETLLKNLYNKMENIDTSIFKISELKNNLDLYINKALLLEQLHKILKR